MRWMRQRAFAGRSGAVRVFRTRCDAGSREETTSKRKNWSFGSDSIRTDKRSVCRSVCRSICFGPSAAGLTAERAGLVDCGLEVGLAVAEGDAALADRHAAIG